MHLESAGCKPRNSDTFLWDIDKICVCVCWGVEVVRQSGTVSSCCYETDGLTRGGERESERVRETMAERKRERERERRVLQDQLYTFPAPLYDFLRRPNSELQLTNCHSVRMHCVCTMTDRKNKQAHLKPPWHLCPRTLSQICHFFFFVSPSLSDYFFYSNFHALWHIQYVFHDFELRPKTHVFPHQWSADEFSASTNFIQECDDVRSTGSVR